MARIRTIKPEFPQSESMGNVSRDARGHFKKKAVTAEERRALAKKHGCTPGGEANATCAYCDFSGLVRWVEQDRGAGWVQFIGLEIDHVHPEYLGGFGGENLVLACLPCNRGKGHKPLKQWMAE